VPADVILYWVSFSLVVVGIVLTFTVWWDWAYMSLASGLAVLTAACLVRGYWPEDFAMATLSAVSGLGIVYVAYREKRKHARTEEHEGQVDGVLPEGSGD
jgi:hypothetical protein